MDSPAKNLEAQAKNTLETIMDLTELNPHMKIYLSYRSCGFNFRESCKLSGISETTVRRWREDYPKFGDIDSKENLRELVDKFSYRFIELEFLRNYRMVLKKDYDVLERSIFMPLEMSATENQYLLKLRGQYTPEQLAMVKKLMESAGMEEMSFTQLVLQFGEQKVQLISGSARKEIRE